MSRDIVWQDCVDWLRAAKHTTVLRYVANLIDWQVEMRHPYTPVNPALRAFVLRYDWPEFWALVSQIERERKQAAA